MKDAGRYSYGVVVCTKDKKKRRELIFSIKRVIMAWGRVGQP